ncbi:MAG: rhodanese-like domain-containing protein [Alphaproteobacteria bacterium]
MTKELKSIDAREAARLRDAGATLVDVREAHEYARGHIAGSMNVALSSWASANLHTERGQPLVFLCASGNRTTINAKPIAAKAGGADAYVLSGGLAAWKRAGLPVDRPARGGGGLLSGLFGR